MRSIEHIRDVRNEQKTIEALMSKNPARDLLKQLQDLNPDASPADLKDLMSDQIERSPETLRRAIFDDVFDEFIRETGHKPSDENVTIDELMKWLQKPKN